MSEEYVLIKNNGIGFIHQQNIHNCCIFIALGVMWKIINKSDFQFHEDIFKNNISRDVTPEEMVYSILKVKIPQLVAPLGDTQIDTLIEHFTKYTELKISVVLAENGMKWDLFDGNACPDGIIIQHDNHYDCAILKKYME